ncbi:hypothetical protein LMH73_018165 [Vibrio splendidus]|nr:hypothetical protein [Vibrio splendidus]MCC4882940.1 hypothetical protein [Vibrio splendidus]
MKFVIVTQDHSKSVVVSDMTECGVIASGTVKICLKGKQNATIAPTYPDNEQILHDQFKFVSLDEVATFNEVEKVTELKLTPEERKQAIEWMVGNVDISTIAQHFEMNSEEMKAELSTIA